MGRKGYRAGLIILLVLACIFKLTFHDVGFWVLWVAALVWWVINNVEFTFGRD